eukprot:gene11530-15445_t
MSLHLKESKKIEGAHNDCIWSVLWNNTGLYTGSLDGTLKIWDVASDNNNQSITNITNTFTSNKRKVGITSIACTSTGSTVIACYENSNIEFINLSRNSDDENDSTIKASYSIIEPGLFEAWSISLSPGDDVLASGTNRGGVNVWSMSPDGQHEQIKTIETQNKFIISTAFSIDGKFATAGVDGIVNLIDMTTQQIVHKLDAHALPIRSIVFSPDGDLVYTASDDRHVSVYDIHNGLLINSFSHSGMAYSVDVSPNKRHFAVGNSDYSTSIWDLGMQKRVQKFDAHHDLVWGVSFDKSVSSGRRFASVGDDTLLQLYE